MNVHHNEFEMAWKIVLQQTFGNINIASKIKWDTCINTSL